jgi:RHS repeat-associated protein
VYGPGGNKLALMSGQTLAKGFVPLSGGATAVYNASGLAYYRHADWLGSSRLASLPSGTTRLYYDGAYAPYGENYAEVGTIDRNLTGQNQDTISSGPYPLYDFLAREYHPTWGRWLNPDPAGLAAVDPSNPQSWNRYAYVTNNPLALTDPTGLGDCAPSDGACQAAAAQMNGAIYSYMSNLALESFDLRTEFGMLEVPVVTAKWVQPYQVTVTIDGVEYPAGPMVPGYWTWATVGTADSLIRDFMGRVPLAGSGFVPLLPVGYGAVGAVATGAVIPQQRVGCVGGGVGAAFPPSKGVSVGPLIHGNLTKALSILTGWSLSLTIQPSPALGYQVVANFSGVLGGPTFGTPGVSFGYTTSACTGGAQ